MIPVSVSECKRLPGFAVYPGGAAILFSKPGRLGATLRKSRMMLPRTSVRRKRARMKRYGRVQKSNP
jgi:hypothetical protein